MTTRYFLAFPASEELTAAIEKVLMLHSTQAEESWVLHLSHVIDLLVPDLMQAFLLDSCDAVGIGSRANRVVRSTTRNICSAISMMAGKMLSKRQNDELSHMADFINEIYIPATQCSTGKASVGCELGPSLFNEVKILLSFAVCKNMHIAKVFSIFYGYK